MQEIGSAAGKHSDDPIEIITRHAFLFALCLSVLWHLALLASVKVYVGSRDAGPPAASKVSFIGSILEDRPMTASNRTGKTYPKEVPPANLGTSEIFDAQRLKAADSMKIVPLPDTYSSRSKPLGREEYSGTKDIPEKAVDKVKVAYKTFQTDIEGPARTREVVYKPELPNYLSWDEGLGVDLDRLGNRFTMELKFWVSPEGRVDSVERISSSGHPTVDIIGMRYLKGWQFTPLRSAGAGQNQWGTVKLDFTLSKAEDK